jgi:hypothetical protein
MLSSGNNHVDIGKRSPESSKATAMSNFAAANLTRAAETRSKMTA